MAASAFGPEETHFDDDEGYPQQQYPRRSNPRKQKINQDNYESAEVQRPDVPQNDPSESLEPTFKGYGGSESIGLPRNFFE